MLPIGLVGLALAGDQRPIDQELGNLIGNAIEFTETGSLYPPSAHTLSIYPVLDGC